MKSHVIVIFIIIILQFVLLTSISAAQECVLDGVCDTACIDNTIDEFDPDCGVAETDLYGLNTVEKTRTEGRTITTPLQTQQECSPLKDGKCTDCVGVDLDCLCGDRVCQSHENYATCSKDCTQNVLCPITRDGICDESCRPFDADCAGGKISQTAREIEERYDLPYQTIETTLVLILLALCGTAVYLMHKAFEIKNKQ